MVPKVHVNDLRILTPLFDQYTNAHIDIDCLMEGAYQNTDMTFLLYDKNDVIAQRTLKSHHQLKVSFEINHPKLWSSEDPYLYQLIIVVKENNQILEIVRQNIGIREFKIIDGLMCINGKRIVFHGVNRHEFSPKTGRVISYQETKKDLLIMKDNNINALRTSHYPNQSFVYDLCDELGLHVIDEVNLETHGTWSEMFDEEHILPNDQHEWLDIVLDRANSMYERDKNHPSIVMWSLGNESHGGSVLYQEAQFLRQKDQSRVIHYEGISHDRRYPQTSDVESQMYTPVDEVEQFIKEHPEKPFLLCEYAHSMGNSNGALFKYTDLEKREPLYQGGFIWDFVDQALYDEKGVLRYGGDFQERPSDYDFCGNGIVFADRTITPKMQEVKYCYQYIQIDIHKDYIQITNNYLFTNLNQYCFQIKLCKDGHVIDKINKKIDLLPGEKMVFNNPYKIEKQDHLYSLLISVIDKNNKEVAYEQFVYDYEYIEEEVSQKIEIAEDYLNIGVTGQNFSVKFAKNKGLTSYQYKDQEMIRTIPKPNFFRASTNNDVENQYGFRYAQWLTASLFSKVEFIKVEKASDKCQVYFDYLLPNLGKEKVHLIYSVYGDGKVVIDMDYMPSSQYIEMPAFGMMLTLYKEFQQVEYLGYGPEENYIDRNKGAVLGHYQYDVSNNVTPYLYPQECGNRTHVYSIQIHDGKHSLNVKGDHLEFSALPYTPFELENAKHIDELPQPYQTVICIYEKQMGIAGDNTWGAQTHKEFLLSHKEKHHLHFSIKGE